MKTASDYYSSHMVKFEPYDCLGGACINIAHQLYSKPWDNTALAFLHAFNPTSIRVTEGECKTDSRLGRITVYVTRGLISSIELETKFGLYGSDDNEIDEVHNYLHELGNK